MDPSAFACLPSCSWLLTLTTLDICGLAWQLSLYPGQWLRERSEEQGFSLPCLALTCYCCNSGSAAYKNGEHSWHQTLLLPATLHTVQYSSAELSQSAFVHCWVVLDSLWLHYGLTLSTGEWKIDDVAVTIAVTQQGKRKDTPLGTCLPIPHSFHCCVLPHRVPGADLRSSEALLLWRANS